LTLLLWLLAAPRGSVFFLSMAMGVGACKGAGMKKGVGIFL